MNLLHFMRYDGTYQIMYRPSSGLLTIRRSSMKLKNVFKEVQEKNHNIEMVAERCSPKNRILPTNQNITDILLIEVFVSFYLSPFLT